MIVDTIDNKKFNATLSGGVAKAIEIAAKTDFTTMADGRYEVDGDKLYYIVMRYKTRPVEKGKLEAHRKYIDVQYVVSGCEAIGYAPLESMMPDTEYDGTKDILFFQNTPLMTKLILTQGMYSVLYPEDGHAPCLTALDEQEILKVVFKVKV